MAILVPWCPPGRSLMECINLFHGGNLRGYETGLSVWKFQIEQLRANVVGGEYLGMEICIIESSLIIPMI